MKNKWKIVAALLCAAFTLTYTPVKAAAVNSFTLQSEGMAWEQFCHVMSTNSAAFTAFTAGLQLDVAGIVPGTGVATWIGTPTSANFLSAITNETGTGLVMGNNSPTIITPVITTSIRPGTDDGATLGDTTHNFSDLFLATGSVINFQNSNVVLTHSSGILTLGTGELRITTAGTNAASVPTLGSTSTFTNKTLTAPVLGGSITGTYTLAGTPTLTSPTINTPTVVTPVISTGLTASGSASNDFSSSTGTFKTSSGVTTITGPLVRASSSRSGPGAVAVTTSLCKLTTTGVADALTLANGTDGQELTIVHDVDGGSAVLTPTTKTGFTTITFTNVGETATLVYVTTRGWMVKSLYLAVAAP